MNTPEDMEMRIPGTEGKRKEKMARSTKLRMTDTLIVHWVQRRSYATDRPVGQRFTTSPFHTSRIPDHRKLGLLVATYFRALDTTARSPA